MGPREEEGLRRGRVGAGSGQERGSRPEGRDNCEREAVGHRSGGILLLRGAHAAFRKAQGAFCGFWSKDLLH